jgi:hypothetical protein
VAVFCFDFLKINKYSKEELYFLIFQEEASNIQTLLLEQITSLSQNDIEEHVLTGLSR